MLRINKDIISSPVLLGGRTFLAPLEVTACYMHIGDVFLSANQSEQEFLETVKTLGDIKLFAYG